MDASVKEMKQDSGLEMPTHVLSCEMKCEKSCILSIGEVKVGHTVAINILKCSTAPPLDTRDGSKLDSQTKLPNLKIGFRQSEIQWDAKNMGCKCFDSRNFGVRITKDPMCQR